MWNPGIADNSDLPASLEAVEVFQRLCEQGRMRTRTARTWHAAKSCTARKSSHFHQVSASACGQAKKASPRLLQMRAVCRALCAFHRATLSASPQRSSVVPAHLEAMRDLMVDGLDADFGVERDMGPELTLIMSFAQEVMQALEILGLDYESEYTDLEYSVDLALPHERIAIEVLPKVSCPM